MSLFGISLAEIRLKTHPKLDTLREISLPYIVQLYRNEPESVDPAMSVCSTIFMLLSGQRSPVTYTMAPKSGNSMVPSTATDCQSEPASGIGCQDCPRGSICQSRQHTEHIRRRPERLSKAPAHCAAATRARFHVLRICAHRVCKMDTHRLPYGGAHVLRTLAVTCIARHTHPATDAANKTRRPPQ